MPLCAISFSKDVKCDGRKAGAKKRVFSEKNQVFWFDDFYFSKKTDFPDASYIWAALTMPNFFATPFLYSHFLTEHSWVLLYNLWITLFSCSILSL